MSSEWIQTTWGELASLEYGKGIRGYQEAAAPYRVYGTNGPVGWHTEPLCSGAGVVIGRKGAYRGVHFSPAPFYVIDTAFYLRPKVAIDIRWAYYQLLTVDINGMDSGSAIPSTSRDEFYKVPVVVPPIHEQSAIAELLVRLDDRIALLRETNATLEAIAQALFKSWFVDSDPVRAKRDGRAPEGMDEATAALFPDSFEDSELGEVPRGWACSPLKAQVEGVYDGPHATPPEADEGPVFLGIKNLTGTRLNLGEVRHIAEADWQQWTRRVTPSAGDIVFSYEATLGFFALIPAGLRCCLGRRLALVRPNAVDGTPHFWLHQFTASPFQRLLDKHTIHGATVNRLALKSFPDLPVLVPPIELRRAFDDAVGPIWSTIHINDTRAQLLASIRDTLLPRLISGQLRLPATDPVPHQAASQNAPMPAAARQGALHAD